MSRRAVPLCETLPYSVRRRREPPSAKTKAWWEVVQRFDSIKKAIAFAAASAEPLAVFESMKMVQRPPRRAATKPAHECVVVRPVIVPDNGAHILTGRP